MTLWEVTQINGPVTACPWIVNEEAKAQTFAGLMRLWGAFPRIRETTWEELPHTVLCPPACIDLAEAIRGTGRIAICIDL